MTALKLVMTTAGLGRFTAAQASDDIDLTIASVGLTAAAFVAAPTLTDLPGEFRRLGTVSGSVEAQNIVHLTVTDDAAVSYAVTGLGLFLADGTLFAAYSQADTMVEKSVGSLVALAIDIAFPAAGVDQLTFGDTSFLNPPATEARKGVVELATEDETFAGLDPLRVPSVLALAKTVARWITTALDARLGIGAPTEWSKGLLGAATAGAARTTLGLGGAAQKAADFYAEAGRSVSGGGLASGGGDLSADRTITVDAASVAEVDAGKVSTKAVTPSALANVLEALANSVRRTRKISTSGLATGGGDLSADRTITVDAASAAEVQTGTALDKAVTPAVLKEAGVIYVVRSSLTAQAGYREWSDGFIEQWGYINGSYPGELSVNIDFPIAFKTECFGVSGTVRNTAQTTSGSHLVQEVSVSLTGAVVFLQSDNANTGDAAGGFRWRAKGR